MKKSGSRRELLWLLAVLIVVSLGARLMSARHGSFVGTRITWTERFRERVVNVEVTGDRLGGGRVQATSSVGDVVVASLDEPVSASDFSTLLDSLEAAGAWTVDGRVYDPGRLPHNMLRIEADGRVHEIAFESRETPQHAMLDAAVDHGFIGGIMGRLQAEGGAGMQRRGPGRRPGPPDRDPRRDPGRNPGQPPPDRDPGRNPGQPPPDRDPGRNPGPPPPGRDPGRRDEAPPAQTLAPPAQGVAPPAQGVAQ